MPHWASGLTRPLPLCRVVSCPQALVTGDRTPLGFSLSGPLWHHWASPSLASLGLSLSGPGDWGSPSFTGARHQRKVRQPNSTTQSTTKRRDDSRLKQKAMCTCTEKTCNGGPPCPVPFLHTPAPLQAPIARLS